MLCIARRMLSQYVCLSVCPSHRPPHAVIVLKQQISSTPALRDAWGVCIAGCIRRNTAYYCTMHTAYLRHASCMQDAMHHACRMQCIVVWMQHSGYIKWHVLGVNIVLKIWVFHLFCLCASIVRWRWNDYMCTGNMVLLSLIYYCVCPLR